MDKTICSAVNMISTDVGVVKRESDIDGQDEHQIEDAASSAYSCLRRAVS